MYAVARNTSGDQANTDYWIADVIVIEIDDEGYAFDDVIIGYWNGSQISRAYNQFIDALSAEEDGVEVTVRPTNSWGSQWTGVADGSSRTYWAYGMVGTSKDEDGNILAALRPLGTTDDPYNKNGVYAGTVTHVDGLRNYIDVDLDGDGKSDDSVAYTGTLAYIIGNNGRNLGTVRISDLTNERIIYVKNSAGRLSYIVDVSYNKNSWNTPSWLAVDLFNDIIEEQKGQWTGNYVEVTEKLWAINLHSSDPQNLKRETLDEYKALRNLLQDMYDHPSNYGLNRADQDKIQATLTSADKAIALSEPWVNANEAYAEAIEEIETAMVASLQAKDTNHRITDYVAVLSDEMVTFTFTDNGTSYADKTMVWVLDQWTGNLRTKANTEYGAGGGSAVSGALSAYVTTLKNQTEAVATAYVGVLDDQQTTQGSNITNKTFLGDQDPDFKNGILVLSGTAVANTGLVRELYGAQLSNTSEPFSVLPISFQEYAGDLQDKGYTKFDVTVYNPALLHETGEDSIVREDKSWSDLADFAILLENGKDVKVVITGINTDGSAVANPDRVVINIDNNFIGTVGTASAS